MTIADKTIWHQAWGSLEPLKIDKVTDRYIWVVYWSGKEILPDGTIIGIGLKKWRRLNRTKLEQEGRVFHKHGDYYLENPNAKPVDEVDVVGSDAWKKRQWELYEKAKALLDATCGHVRVTYSD